MGERTIGAAIENDGMFRLWAGLGRAVKQLFEKSNTGIMCRTWR